MFIWENGTFLFLQHFIQIAGTWSGEESGYFKIPYFWPKIQFFQFDTVFFQKTIGGHGHGLRIGVGPVPKSFFVSEVGHFSLKSLNHPH